MRRSMTDIQSTAAEIRRGKKRKKKKKETTGQKCNGPLLHRAAIASRRKFTILWRHVEEVLLMLNEIYFLIVDTCLSCEDTARQSCAMVPRWRFFGDFLANFQRAACSKFQTCILNMADIQSAMAEIRRRKKDRR